MWREKGKPPHPSYSAIRSQVTWSDYGHTAGGAQVTLHTRAALAGATVLWLGGAQGRTTVDGLAADASTVTRWGFPFHAVSFDAAADGYTRLTFQPSETA